MFAPDEVLAALIGEAEALSKTLSFRDELWERINTQEFNRKELPSESVKNRTYFKSELMEFLKTLPPDLAKQFDPSLGKKGAIAYIEDPSTGIVYRERLMKKTL